MFCVPQGRICCVRASELCRYAGKTDQICQPGKGVMKEVHGSDSLQVFWIIIGTGSVNVISFNTLSNATETASTAKSTPSQYGRKLLQSAAAAENVVFAVTLPTASQNSLLVLQSSSDTVRQQFSGWFVTQMQARGKPAQLANLLTGTARP